MADAGEGHRLRRDPARATRILGVLALLQPVAGLIHVPLLIMVPRAASLLPTPALQRAAFLPVLLTAVPSGFGAIFPLGCCALASPALACGLFAYGGTIDPPDPAGRRAIGLALLTVPAHALLCLANWYFGRMLYH